MFMYTKLKLVFHGAAREVGRSCIELRTGENTYLLDAGIKITEDGLEYPSHITGLKALDGVFISHAHLDHIGALPLLNHYGLNCPIFCTGMTKKISNILLKDSLKVELLEERHPAYTKDNINKILDSARTTQLNKENSFNELKYTFFNAGHIPGSSLIKIEVNGKKILYSGDLNTIETELLRKADDNYGDIDVLIIESTYGNREHPKRKIIEDSFLNKVEEVIEKGGSVIIPVFAVGRAQEILLLLSKKRLKVPIYIDGMAIRVTRTFLTQGETLKDMKLLSQMFKKIRKIRKSKDRFEAMRKPGIYLTTSGMIEGGPVLEYLKHMCFKKENAVLMTGYQAEGSNGRMLLEEGKAYIDGRCIRPSCFIKKYDFSAHLGKKEILSFIKKVNPKTVIINHGDVESENELAESIEGKKVYVPTLDTEIEM